MRWNAKVVRIQRTSRFHGFNFRAQLRKISTGGRTPRTIVSIQALGLWIPNNCEYIPPNTVTRGLHKPESRIRCDGRIDRGATLLQNIDRNLRGQWLSRRGHPISPEYRAT